jgi:two-component sensor histidine kinase
MGFLAYVFGGRPGLLLWPGRDGGQDGTGRTGAGSGCAASIAENGSQRATHRVAHDFNNLLTIIRSSADLLRRPVLSEDRRRRYVDAISNTADRAAGLTGQLLAFARQQALLPSVFDVRDLLQHLVEMLRSVLGSRIELQLALSEKPVPVEADLSQIETALVNLAANARDAMNGEGRLTISLKDMRDQHATEFVAVSVGDTGCGIPADKLAHVFEPFFTTKEVGRGTGLGLSQVYGFVQQSGGKVTVDSVEGRGATFTLLLPRTAKALSPVEPHEHALADAREGCCILVVEDNTEVGEFSTQLLNDSRRKAATGSPSCTSHIPSKAFPRCCAPWRDRHRARQLGDGGCPDDTRKQHCHELRSARAAGSIVSRWYQPTPRPQAARCTAGAVLADQLRPFQ